MALLISRIYKIAILCFAIGCLLIGRLVYLQIIENTNLVRESVSMRMQEVPIEVTRGEIVDRTGLSLTYGGQYFTMVIFPQQIKNLPNLSAQLSEATGLPAEFFVEQVSSHNLPFKLKIMIDSVTRRKINNLKTTHISHTHKYISSISLLERVGETVAILKFISNLLSISHP